MSVRFFFPVFLLFLFNGSLTHGQSLTDIFVSPAGSDRNNGSLSEPLQTLQAALEKVATATGNQVHIWLRAGTYYQERSIEIDETVLAGHSLAIQAYEHEPVTISGAKKIRPEWESWKGKVLWAKIGKDLSIDQLFCNGHALPMARYPNYDSTSAIYHGTAVDAISPERVRTWSNPAGGYVHALHQGMWGSFDYLITGKDSPGKLRLEGGWQNNRPSAMHDHYRFVENIFEELDAPGEWFYNAAEGVLYFYPPWDIDPSTALFEISQLNDIMILKGSEMEPVRHVRIASICFAGTSRTFMLTKEPLLRSDWTIYRGGALLIQGCKDVSIAGCRFQWLGGNAIFVSGYNRNIQIEGNEISDIGASAILFVGDPKAVRSPSFRYEEFVPLSGMEMTPGPKTNDYPSDCLAYDNLIHHVGAIEKQGAGVEINMAQNIKISHNTIYDVPRAGINIGDGCWGGDTIEYNDVFNTVLETGDHGAFNSWGRDRFWLPDSKRVDTMVEQNPDLPLLDAVRPVVIRNNRWYCAHGWDIDLDDGSTNFRIYNNVCLSGGLKLREGYDRIVENNIIVNNSFHPHVWYKNSRDVFRYNIVTTRYEPILMDYWGKEIDSNFFLQKSALDDARKNGTDAHSLYGDSSKAFSIGFRGFLTNDVGVLSKDLKKKAASPVIHDIRMIQQSGGAASAVVWLGASVKDVETLGEQSSTGLPDKDGALITAVDRGSLAAKNGLQKGDVVRSIDGIKIGSVSDLLKVAGGLSTSQAAVLIFRNQQVRQILVRVK